MITRSLHGTAARRGGGTYYAIVAQYRSPSIRLGRGCQVSSRGSAASARQRQAGECAPKLLRHPSRKASECQQAGPARARFTRPYADDWSNYLFDTQLAFSPWDCSAALTNMRNVYPRTFVPPSHYECFRAGMGHASERARRTPLWGTAPEAG